jgi:hypothetical protein
VDIIAVFAWLSALLGIKRAGVAMSRPDDWYQKARTSAAGRWRRRRRLTNAPERLVDCLSLSLYQDLRLSRHIMKKAAHQLRCACSDYAPGPDQVDGRLRQVCLNVHAHSSKSTCVLVMTHYKTC